MNQTLKQLIVHLDQSTLANLLLESLSGHATLEEIEISNEVQDLGEFLMPTQLHALLHEDGTKPSHLRRLELCGCAFSGEGMNSLLTGLRNNRTLQRIIFAQCHFDTNAKDVFVRFCQEPLLDASGGENDARGALCELGFTCYTNQPAFDDNEPPFNGSLVAEMVAQILHPAQQSEVGSGNGRNGSLTRTSFGSSIRRLILCIDDWDTFFAMAYAEADKIHLPELELRGLDNRDWGSLERYLPHLSHLTTLTMLGGDALSTDTAVATLIQALCNRDCDDSLGSSLQCLALGVHNLEPFLTAYTADAAKIRLPQLELHWLNVNAWNILNQQLPIVLYLTDLAAEESTALPPRAMRTLKTALRRNGSLHRFKFDGLKQLTPKELRHVQAYLDRNQQVPQLLSKSGLVDSSRCLGDNSNGSDNTRSSGQANKEDETSVVMPALVPAVMVSVLPVEQMTPNFVLMGLSALRGDDIGYAARTPSESHSPLTGPRAKRARLGDGQL